MSTALAIASVTAVLKHMLGNTLLQQPTVTGMGDLTVTALPPDRVLTSTEERTQLNLYLYRLTPNSSWRRGAVFASHKASQENPPLALDLHYLLTAYGERDFQAEVLLGHAVQFLYETPVLTRETIRSILASLSQGNGSGPALTALAASTLADQLEQITIRPEFLSLEDLSKLWSSLQARSRLSMTYEVSVVLIEDRHRTTTTEDIPQVMIL
jgi:hypothetical protein